MKRISKRLVLASSLLSAVALALSLALGSVPAHFARARYVHGWGWLTWDDRRWTRDTTGAVMRSAKETVRAILLEAEQAESSEHRKQLFHHARRSEATPRLKALLESARSESGIAKTSDQFDCDAWQLNVLNGTLDLRLGTRQPLCPHDSADHITKLAPVKYDPQATSPLWDHFLADITGHDVELQRYLQRAVGYSLTGKMDEQCLFLCYGTGRNGKSTFLETLRALLGDYAHTLPPETVQARERGQTRGAASNEVAALAGRRFVITSETGRGDRLDLGLVKRLTGGDSIRARYLYQESIEYRPQLKLWIATNHLPAIDEQTSAIWDRLKVILFPARFSQDQRDPRLMDRLKAEAGPAILQWAVEGCRDWQREGLVEPAIVREAVQAYRQAQDPFTDFLDACCWLADDYTVGATALLQAYNAWRDTLDGAPTTPISSKALATRLKEHGFQPVKRKDGNVYRGLALKQPADTVLARAG